jgi:hypothetical protein
MLMVKYRGKYILEGLDEIPPDMLADLDAAYDICMEMHNGSECEMCGKCCHQANITVMDGEIGRIATHLKMNGNEFIEEYLYKRDGLWLFRKSGACRFLNEEKKCRIWEERPLICRDFPYLVAKFMSRVYLSIVNDTTIDLEYMEDSWPCTPKIKGCVEKMIKKARTERKKRIRNARSP